MNIKQEVVRRIQEELEKQQRQLRYHLEKNAAQINKLSEDSAVSKRQLSVLNQMIRDIGGEK